MATGPCGYRVLSLSGRDAVPFAQAQFMNDLGALAPGRWHWNGWLTPKGRVVALFALLMVDAETLWLVLPDADPRALADGLRRFVFRMKVTIADRADILAIGGFAAPASANGNELATNADGAVELDLGTAVAKRSLRLAAAGPDAPRPDPAFDERWRQADLQFGLPRMVESQAGQWTPQQLSLERLNAYSVRKGCYPGQEIVARTHFLGKAKRGLVLLESDAPVDPGADVMAGSTSVGSVMASASDPSGSRHLALAVVALERSAPIDAAGGSAARERTLLDGLAR